MASMRPKRKKAPEDDVELKGLAFIGLSVNQDPDVKLPSLLAGKRPKRLFANHKATNPKRLNTEQSARGANPEMGQLAEYILATEGAFKSRFKSLYADFSSSKETNPDNFHANVTAWKTALINATRAGFVPAPNSTFNLLTLNTGPQLAESLQHRDYGAPACLSYVIEDGVKMGEFIPVKDWTTRTDSIYTSSWWPSVPRVLSWVGTKVLGAWRSDRMPNTTFVVVRNVEVAAEEVLKQLRSSLHGSTTDRMMSAATFMKRYSHALNSGKPMTENDLNVLLIHMSRDKQALSYSGNTIKFKSETESNPSPVTVVDQALVGLQDALENVDRKLNALQEKITSCTLAIKEALNDGQRSRAAAALRTRKLTERHLDYHTNLSIQLQEQYAELQKSADQVETVEAMKAGAEAMAFLNSQIGGVEGVRNIMDVLNDEMATVDEVSRTINESGPIVDEGEIDDELEAIGKEEQAKKEEEAAAQTAARLGELAEAKADAEKVSKEQEYEQELGSKIESTINRVTEHLSTLSVKEEHPAIAA